MPKLHIHAVYNIIYNNGLSEYHKVGPWSETLCKSTSQYVKFLTRKKGKEAVHKTMSA